VVAEAYVLHRHGPAGVRRGAELGTTMSRDVAPTVAHLLQVKLGDVEGKLVADALA